MDDLIKIKGIEKKTAEKFIKNIDNYLEFIKLTKIKCNFESPDTKVNKNNKDSKDSKDNSKLKDINVVFSGFRDKELEKKIEKNGGSIKSTITKSVNYLIIKNKDTKSSKIGKAKELNIEVITLENFNKKF